MPSLTKSEEERYGGADKIQRFLWRMDHQEHHGQDEGW